MNTSKLPETNEPPRLCIYVDADGTLIRNQGGRMEPVPELVARIREWHAEGALLYCWSSQGANYARQIAKTLGLEPCFSTFLCKPHILVDDQALTDWQYFLHRYPSQAANHSTVDLERLLDSIEL